MTTAIRLDAHQLARSVANKATGKYDLFLTNELMSADYASSKLDTEGAFNSIKIITTEV